MGLERLARAIDELLDADPAGLGDCELHEAVIGLQRHNDRLAALRARYLAAWDARRVWADDGSNTPSARLARETGVSSATAKRDLRRAARLRDMPHTATALADGAVSVDQVDLLVTVNQPRLADQFAVMEAELVADAQRLGWRDLQRVLRYWQHHADAVAEDDASRRRYQDRQLHASRSFAGSVELTGTMDPISGDIFLTELHRLEGQLFEADWAAARAEHGDTAGADLLGRNSPQRRHDALVEMARRSAACAADATPARPLLSVVVDVGSVKRTICELADGTVIGPTELARLLAEADVERIVFESPSRVIDVGVRQRFFNAAQRRAVIVRDRHCQHPAGCDVPAEQCQIDHIVEYTDGGLTTLDNARALCRRHNRKRPGRQRPPPDAA